MFFVVGFGLQFLFVLQVVVNFVLLVAAVVVADLLLVSVDLMLWVVFVGDQGQIGLCVLWMVGYMISGWYVCKQGLFGNLYALMFLYSQLMGGKGGLIVGIMFYGNLNFEQIGGIDLLSDFMQGNYIFVVLFIVVQKVNAVGYKIVDWIILYYLQVMVVLQGVGFIKDALVYGWFVVIGIDVYFNFFGINVFNDYYDAVLGLFQGCYALVVFGYDVYGICIENSWGLYWGNKGFVMLLWGFVVVYMLEVYLVNGFIVLLVGAVLVFMLFSVIIGLWLDDVGVYELYFGWGFVEVL